MKLITTPTYQTIDYDSSIFLAGGISGCSDWQGQVLSWLFEYKVTVLNPRRSEQMDRKNLASAKEQIKWERQYITLANHILFWFPKETLCPIALFELGGALDRNIDDGLQTISIGCNIDYDRRLDLEIQLSIIYPNLRIFYNLKDTVENTVNVLGLTKY